MSDQEKVEMQEQVPLKTDTDAPAAETAGEQPAAEPAPAPTKKGFRFFHKKEKKTPAEAPESAEEQKEEKPKKKCWFGGKKSEQEQKADHISIGINLVDRDEKGINDHVKFGFEDIFGEADTAHSWDCVWRLIFKIFSWTRCFFYRLFSLIICVPVAIVFGILFALLTALNTFICMPFGKLASIPAQWIAKTWSYLIHAVVDPIASAVGLLFSSFTIRKYGINSQPTEPCIA